MKVRHVGRGFLTDALKASGREFEKLGGIANPGQCRQVKILDLQILVEGERGHPNRVPSSDSGLLVGFQ